MVCHFLLRENCKSWNSIDIFVSCPVWYCYIFIASLLERYYITFGLWHGHLSVVCDVGEPYWQTL